MKSLKLLPIPFLRYSWCLWRSYWWFVWHWRWKKWMIWMSWNVDSIEIQWIFVGNYFDGWKKLHSSSDPSNLLDNLIKGLFSYKQAFLRPDTKHPSKVKSLMCNEWCDVCDNTKLLERHGKLKHKKRNYACKYCDYKTYSSVQLKEHERTRIGERPEICSFGGQRFSTKMTLKNHGEKPDKCKYCDSSFVQRTLLACHVSSNHWEAFQEDSKKVK